MSAENAPTSAVQNNGVDVAKGLEEAMGRVAKLVENIAKQATSANAVTEETAEAAVDAEIEKSAKGKGEVRKNFRTTLKASGVTGDAYVATLKAFDATLVPASTETTTEKAALAPAPAETPASALSELTEVIEKAKIFTPARQKQLLEMSTALKAIIDDLIHIPQATMPKNPIPGVAHTPDFQVGVTKAITDLTDLVAKSVKASSDALEETQKRLEVVEKSRNPSNGLESTTEKKTVEKAKSIWGNLI